ncbi:MAG: DUF6624 domain-containing protein [Candidatus Paceibacterota bacterium]
MNTTNKKGLVQEIKKQYTIDQNMRRVWSEHDFSLDHYDAQIDKQSESLVEKVLEKIGWPKQSQYGKNTPEELWVLVQHLQDIEIQKRALKEMRKLLPDEIDPKLIAKTTDRILIREGKKQLYGTSFNINLEDNTLSVDPIEDSKNINKRRKELGLDTFEEQKKRAFDSFNNR